MHFFYAFCAVVIIVVLICIGLNLDIIAKNSKLVVDELIRIADALEEKQQKE